MMSSYKSSKLYIPNRALGYVSNHIPLIIRYIHRRKENVIVTCVGKSFHSYGSTHLKLLAVSDLHEDDITCLAGDTYHVYSASCNNVFAWRRGTELKHTFIGHKSSVHALLPFGPHLISVDESSVVKIWNIRSEELFLELSFDNDVFQVTNLCHPSTYLNKILFGSQQGSMQLWNIKTSKLIYSFSGWSSPISVLEQAPAVDVIAIGLVSGKIVLHNIKFDETVLEFTQDWGPVTSLSFRSDGEPIMASGSMAGHVVFWNLEEKKVSSQLLNGHDSAISGLHCLPNEPLMVTSSPDNSLKIWIFDMPDGGVRLLRVREGHSAPPSYIKFHGGNGQSILSAGNDSTLRMFSTVSETANRSFGKASYNRKLAKKKGKQDSIHLLMPPIVQFTSETTREKEWDNIAALHLGLPVVTTWSFHRQKMGELKLFPSNLKRESTDKLHLITSSICLTHCGNFVIVGYSSGNIERFNIQSGLHRNSYGTPLAHNGPVRGVAVDPLNQVVVSGGRDCYVKFWYFKLKGKDPIEVLNVGESVNFFQTHRESSLLCVAMEDFSLIIIDLDTKGIVRRFVGHTGQITDTTFSSDSRWIISASMDCTIRTWDIPSAQLVDCFKVDAACTSLSMSPTGEYLATSHVDYKGIFLWSNKTLFSLVSLKPLAMDSIFPHVSLPSTGNICEELAVEDDDNSDEDDKNELQQIDSLVTLSSLASSRWQNLLDIDLVKKRNKPLEPPKTPKAAPFFLPTLPSLNLEFDLSSVLETEGGGKTLKLQNIIQNLSPFAKLLLNSKDFQPVIDKLKSLGPSAIDFEINSLAVEGQDCENVLLKFMEMLNYVLRTNKDFELGQAYLALFLKVHGNTIASNPTLCSYLDQLHEAQSSGWELLQEKIWYTLAAVDLLNES